MACARGCNVTFAPVKLEMPTEEVHYLAMQSRAGDHWCLSRSSTLLDKRVEQKRVVWSAEIMKYQIRNIIFLYHIYGLIIVTHLTGPQPTQLVLNPFNWYQNSQF